MTVYFAYMCTDVWEKEGAAVIYASVSMVIPCAYS